MKPGGEGTAVRLVGQQGVEAPIFLADEGPDLLLTVDDDPHRGGLDPSSGQALTDLLPQEGAELVAHNPVQDPPGLLRVDQVHIQLPGLGHPLGHSGFGDFIEGHPVVLVSIGPEKTGEMPGDGLSFPVGVGGEDDAVALGCHGLQLTDQGGFSRDIHVTRLEPVFDIHPEQSFGQIPDMAHRRDDFIAGAEVFLNGFRLGGRFHDHQFRHNMVHLFLLITGEASAAFSIPPCKTAVFGGGSPAFYPNIPVPPHLTAVKYLPQSGRRANCRPGKLRAHPAISSSVRPARAAGNASPAFCARISAARGSGVSI